MVKMKLVYLFLSIFAWMRLGSSQSSNETLNQTLIQSLNQGSSHMSLIDWIFVTIIIFFLLLFAILPIVLNMYWSFSPVKNMEKDLRSLIESKDERKIDGDTLLKLVDKCIDAEPKNVSGIGRSSMALTLTLIVGISLIYLFVNNVPDNTMNTIKDILLALIGAISSIVGFYFGGRAVSEATAKTAAVPSIMSTAVNLPPFVIRLEPDKPTPQAAGTTITWTAAAVDPENDKIFYKFLLKGPATNNQWTEKTQWQEDSKWVWTPANADVGTNLIKVYVRDGKHKGLDEYDALSEASYVIY